MAELHILRPWLQKGLGTAGALAVLKRHPGHWSITTWPASAEAPTTTPRVPFWRQVARCASPEGAGAVVEFGPGEHAGFPGQFVWEVQIR